MPDPKYVEINYLLNGTKLYAKFKSEWDEVVPLIMTYGPAKLHKELFGPADNIKIKNPTWKVWYLGCLRIMVSNGRLRIETSGKLAETLGTWRASYLPKLREVLRDGQNL